MGKSKPVTSEEISETEFKDLVSSSVDKVKKFLADNPQVVYKGVPLLLFIYLFYPILLAGWYWFPWIWASYEIYNSIPPGAIPVTAEMVKQFLTYRHKGKLTLKL
uniref:Uncharacterized protein n=1 Tax=Marseillevirus LCMAC101 TaxID=2506602 RepID=A0A481YRH3_9VIRU|nr:MAG: uncharacterized protein LCMAC101_02240 [Marseillevirus LCMAC101]